MSFAEARIEAYRISRASKDQVLTEVRFIQMRVGSLDIAIVAENSHTRTRDDESEHEIAKQLAQEGLLRMPSSPSRARTDFHPVKVKGRPLSEIIIEERR
jgi:hypothetical protein